jgi:hypothetical protein
MSNPDFLAAERAEIDELEALARELLKAHDSKERRADDRAEAEWSYELAHTSRQMRPLLEAIEKADAGQPGYKKWSRGFHFRLIEAMTTTAKLCSHGRLWIISQRKNGREDRPGAKSPMLEFIRNYLRLNPDASNERVKAALMDAAGDVQEPFEFSEDRSEIISYLQRKPGKRARAPTQEPGPRFHIRVDGILQKVSQVRGELEKSPSGNPR